METTLKPEETAFESTETSVFLEEHGLLFDPDAIDSCFGSFTIFFRIFSIVLVIYYIDTKYLTIFKNKINLVK